MATTETFSLQSPRLLSSAFYSNTGDPHEGEFKNNLGLNVHYYLWFPKLQLDANEASLNNKENPQKIRGIVVFLHGYESHSLFGWLFKPLPASYEFDNPADVGYGTKTALLEEINAQNTWNLRFESSWTAQMLDEGFAVAAFDFIGHGLSESWQEKRASLPSIDYLAKDALQFLTLLPEMIKSHLQLKIDSSEVAQQLPIFLCGTSLGGLVIVRTMQLLDQHNELNNMMEKPVKLSGAILLSPLLELSGFENSKLYSIIKLALNIACWLVPHQIVRPHASGYVYPHMEKYAFHDKFTYKEGMRACTAKEFLLMPQKARSENEVNKISPKWCNSLLLLHNALDNIAGIKGSLDFFLKLPIEDKCFHSINSYLNSNLQAENLETILNSNNDRKEGKEIVEQNAYLFSGCVDSLLLQTLQPYSSSDLHGIDVFHSIATEPGQTAVFKKVLLFLKKRAPSVYTLQ